MRFWCSFLPVLISTLLLGSLPRAAAQANPAGKREHAAPARTQNERADAYTRFVTKAVAAFDAGRYEEAREQMMYAHQLSPSARTLRGMGLAAFQARRYALASLDFEGALAEKRGPLTDEQREEIERLQADANALTARYRLTGQVPGAVILIDEEPPAMDAGGFLVLDAGEHTLSLRRAGGDERTMRIRAEGGKWSDLDVGLQRVSRPSSGPQAVPSGAVAPAPRVISTPAPPPLAAAPRPPAPLLAEVPAPEPPPSEHAAKQGIRTAFVSAAIGGAAISAGFAVWQWRSRESEVDIWNSQSCLAGGRSRRTNCGSHERAYKNAERWTWVAAGTALVLTGGAVTLLLLDSSNSEKRERAGLRCGAGPLAIQCQGSF